jgi:hypothetical protein
MRELISYYLQALLRIGFSRMPLSFVAEAPLDNYCTFHMVSE